MIRNKYALRMVIGFIVIFAVCFCLSVYYNSAALWIMGAGMLLMGIIFSYYTWIRYRDIKRLAASIHQFQRGSQKLSMESYCEGELSYLTAEIQKMELKLTEQAQMLAADKNYLADAISDISHQLKTPLTTMSMMTDFLGSSNLTEEKRSEFISNLRSQLSRIEWLVQSLLKMARLDAGSVTMKRQPVNVALLMKKSSQPLLIPIELKGQELIVNCNDDIYITGDLDWLREAFGNILKNCMEHMDEGKKLCVDVTDNPLYVRIVISDEGCGIAAQDLPHIFERFYKGKNASSDSVGIGLAMAWQIIHYFDGDIQVESTEGAGTKFTVKLYK